MIDQSTNPSTNWSTSGGTHWAPLWLMFLMLHEHYPTYVFFCRNTELKTTKVYSPVYSVRPCSYKMSKDTCS